MKKIIFTFLSCVMLAGLLSVESIAAVVVDSALPNSRRYTGVMHDLVRENRDRRKAFNKHEDTAQNTQKIDAILKDRKRVSTRPASDTEKDDILKLLMATVITDPDTLSTKMTTNLDVAKSSSDPLDRHSYIVDMAGSFAHELIMTGKIESDFGTFETFSGVDKDRFLKLFYQVKGNHRRGLKIPSQPDIAEISVIAKNNAHPYQLYALNGLGILANEIGVHAVAAMNTLIEISRDNAHQYQFAALHELSIVAIKGNDEGLRKKASEALMSIAADDTHPRQSDALFILKDIATKGNDEDIRNKVLQIISVIAGHNSHLLQIDALVYKIESAKDKYIRQDALRILIKIKNDKDNPRRDDALFKLMEIALFENGTELGDAAQKALSLDHQEFRKEANDIQVTGKKVREKADSLSLELRNLSSSLWERIAKPNRIHNPIQKVR